MRARLQCKNDILIFAVKPLLRGSWFHFSREHFDVIFMVAGIGYGKLLSMVV